MITWLKKIILSDKQSKKKSIENKWYKVTRDGKEFLESESYRKNLAETEKIKIDLATKRASLNIDLAKIEYNANLLMESMKSFYQFGDPTFSPDIIYRKAAEEFGFEPYYVSKLVDNLVKREIVGFEYITDEDVHPKDRLDYWRLTKKA